NGVLIEQLDNGRGLTPERYHETFTRSGFRVVREHPIRRSLGSRWLRFASSKRCPPALNKFAARGEIAQASRTRFRAQTQGYFDCLFVLERDS
ncbi:MAG TPA: hypothetical protein VEJ41_08240, partial [Candidatus Acidoferrales bacterium]|nr:hypothetical protein [Candidatus Acidoferrales bacterium]